VTPGNSDLRAILHLTLAQGLGPVLIARLLEAFGTADSVLGLSASQLAKVRGIGLGTTSKPGRADEIAKGLASAGPAVDRELDLAAKLGVSFLLKNSDTYPRLLAEIPGAPPLLYLRGRIDADGADRYPVAIVGSRDCTAYGTEQAGRFASVLAAAGLTIISGGAKGVDAAGHRGALRARGRTIVVQGCGLSGSYPPEHAPLYESIVNDDAGAIISELPLSTPPAKENFPARNRIISGMSLGVLVIEAAHKSGSLITARCALDEHNREVFALPGRVDSPSSRGSLELLKRGEAALVTEPGDVLAALESPARHHHAGTHESRYATAHRSEANLFDAPPNTDPPDTPAKKMPATSNPARPAPAPTLLTPRQASIVSALEATELTFDQIVDVTGLDAAEARAELTMLEIQRRIAREGPKFRKK
jgi:DNA processing protein